MKIIQIVDIAQAKYRKRTINIWEEMTPYQKRECYYGFGMWNPNKCKCSTAHNFDPKYCNNK